VGFEFTRQRLFQCLGQTVENLCKRILHSKNERLHRNSGTRTSPGSVCPTCVAWSDRSRSIVGQLKKQSNYSCDFRSGSSMPRKIDSLEKRQKDASRQQRQKPQSKPSINASANKFRCVARYDQDASWHYIIARLARARKLSIYGEVEGQGTTTRRGCANFRFRSVRSVHSFWTMPGFGPGMSAFLQNLSVNASVPWCKVRGILNSFRDQSASA
jgi:hypothetical protein